MSISADATRSHYRWNHVAFVIDYVFFGIAMSFARPNSVLPAFVSQFTRSAPVIGLVSTVLNGCWLLPQVASAQWISGMARKKPYLVAAMGGRVGFWIIALALWLGLAQRANLMLLLFFVCFGLFATCDGLASVAWFDLLARSIPIKRRGGLMGIAQVISGLAGLGVGWVITQVLTGTRFPFPENYALIFTFAAVAFIPSAIALISLREPRIDPVEHEPRRPRKNGWLTPFARDPAFRRFVLCRVLVGLVALVSPFYVIHATDVLALSPAVVGSFVAAQQVGALVSGALLGLVSNRWGPLLTARISSALTIAAPAFALGAHLAQDSFLVQAYPLVYFVLGVYQSSSMLGFYNYLLEIAPDDLRPSYIGLANTTLGILTLAPTLGGWLLEATSYTVLFGLTVVLVSLGFVVALNMRPSANQTREPMPVHERGL